MCGCTSRIVSNEHADVSRETPPPPGQAAEVFSSRLPLAVRFADWLAGAGVERGLIGPREIPRLWDRHLLNCAVVAPAIPADARIADVGSGAGLPGLVWAIVRPDVHVTLIEPLRRRTTFLEEVTDALALGDQVTIGRGRAEDHPMTSGYDVVTARAVAAQPKLVRWCLPLVRPGGLMVALKGSRAEEEVRDAASTVRRLGGTDVIVKTYGGDLLEVPTTVIEVRRGFVRRDSGG